MTVHTFSAFLILLSLVVPLNAVEARVDATSTSLLVEPVDASRQRVVPLKFYLPALDKPVPVVLFSHGLGGSRNNNAYLGTSWAEAGYAAVFMQHLGSDESVWKDAPPLRRMSELKKAASRQAALDRVQDVTFVIDQLEQWNATQGHALQGKLDLSKIGMSGHSFGAVTTQGVMSQKRSGVSRAELRIKAFLLMSPSTPRFGTSQSRYGDIHLPVLCMTGTEDGSPIEKDFDPLTRQEVYAALPVGDKYQLVFEGGHHFVFGDRDLLGREQRDSRHHPAIQKISIAFWDAYLKGEKKAKTWLQSEALKTELRLDPKDRWEWK
ncbi:MAG: alpha/beta hydrolase family protein [Candidatus Methylacidiphilales bacterium]